MEENMEESLKQQEKEHNENEEIKEMGKYVKSLFFHV